MQPCNLPRQSSTYFEQDIQFVAGRNPILAKNIEAGLIKRKTPALNNDLFANRYFRDIRGIARTGRNQQYQEEREKCPCKEAASHGSGSPIYAGRHMVSPSIENCSQHLSSHRLDFVFDVLCYSPLRVFTGYNQYDPIEMGRCQGSV